MKDVSEATLKRFGLAVVVRRGGGVVAIRTKLRKDYDRGAGRDIVSIERWMEHWCDGRDLLPERFKVNLRRKGGVRIDEFKAYQLRAYGFSTTVGDKKLFVITAVDIKKQNRASADVLDRAERIALELKAELND